MGGEPAQLVVVLERARGALGDGDAAVAAADRALYAAKAAGRNTFRLISADDRTRHLREAPVAGEGAGAAPSSASPARSPTR